MHIKVFFIVLLLLLSFSCNKSRDSKHIEALKQNISFENPSQVGTYLTSINASDLKTYVYTLASDSMSGRGTGTKGHQKAADYLSTYYNTLQIPPPFHQKDYFQKLPDSYRDKSVKGSSNVLAYIEGKTHPEEVIIISAHLDHLGRIDSHIYPGADDNASGTAALMSIAQAFQKAYNAGHRPERSLLFLHLTGEEIGLLGSYYYLEDPLFKTNQTIANLNIDMIGRIDEAHRDNPNYIYLIGSDKISTELHYISEAANSNFTNLELNYTYNDLDHKSRYYYRSDHYNFAKEDIPVIFYFNGEHEDYHKPTDTPDKIQYELLQRRTQLIFATAWYLANSPNRLQKDAQF